MLKHALMKDARTEPKILIKLSAKFKAACDGEELVRVLSNVHCQLSLTHMCVYIYVYVYVCVCIVD